VVRTITCIERIRQVFGTRSQWNALPRLGFGHFGRIVEPGINAGQAPVETSSLLVPIGVSPVGAADDQHAPRTSRIEDFLDDLFHPDDFQ
jgi:hypothetical protein